MICTKTANGYAVTAKKYSLEVSERKIAVILKKVPVATLCPISAVDTLCGEEVVGDIDEKTLVFEAKVDIADNRPVFSWTTKSNLLSLIHI